MLVPFENTVEDKSLLTEFQPAERYDPDDSEREDRKQEVLLLDDVFKGNESTVEENGVESVDVGLPSSSAGGAKVDVDAAKPAHADEM